MTVIPMAPSEAHARTAYQRALLLTGETGASASRARLVALAAMRSAFRVARVKDLAVLIGFEEPVKAVSNLRKARTTNNWWRDEWVDDVVGALVADRYGDQAL